MPVESQRRWASLVQPAGGSLGAEFSWAALLLLSGGLGDSSLGPGSGSHGFWQLPQLRLSTLRVRCESYLAPAFANTRACQKGDSGARPCVFWKVAHATLFWSVPPWSSRALPSPSQSLTPCPLLQLARPRSPSGARLVLPEQTKPEEGREARHKAGLLTTKPQASVGSFG